MNLKDWMNQIHIKCESANKLLVYNTLFSYVKSDKPLKVLLCFLGSQYYLERAKHIHPNWDIYVLDDVHFKFAYNKSVSDRVAFVNIDKIMDSKNGKGDLYENVCTTFKNLTVDYILMNPPYDGNLHLKIVEQVLPMLKDDKSICVNLSPVRWLQDPLAKYKKGSDYNKFEDSISKHIASVDTIKAEVATGLFNVLFPQDLGIYMINKSGGFDYVNKPEDLFVNNILAFPLHWNDVMEENKVDGIRVKCQKLRNSGPSSNCTNLKSYTKPKDSYDLMYRHYCCVFIDGMQDGKWWTEFGNKNKYTKPVGTPLMDSIKFNSYESAIRFEKSCKTAFMLYCNYISKVGVHTDFNFIPYLGSTENPRTHKMGYESDWTNEDLCKVFGITGFISDTEAEPGSEWETILETMKPYLD